MEKRIVFGACLLGAALASCSAPHDAARDPQEAAAEAARPLPPSYDWRTAIAGIKEDAKADPWFASCLANAARTCESSYGSKKAVDSDDLELCGGLSDPSVRASCRTAVVDARVAKGAGADACLRLPAEEATSCLERHLPAAAVARKDAAACLEYAQYFASGSSDYEVSMCALQALQGLGGQGAADLCPRLRHDGNRKICRETWLTGASGSTGAAR